MVHVALVTSLLSEPLFSHLNWGPYWETHSLHEDSQQSLAQSRLQEITGIVMPEGLLGASFCVRHLTSSPWPLPELG